MRRAQRAVRLWPSGLGNPGHPGGPRIPRTADPCRYPLRQSGTAPWPADKIDRPRAVAANPEPHRRVLLAMSLKSSKLQLNEQGQLRHFLDINGLSRALGTEFRGTADSSLGVGERSIKKVPPLRGKPVCNVCFESSARTRSTFELAAKRLSADVLNLEVPTSSTCKGETLYDS